MRLMIDGESTHLRIWNAFFHVDNSGLRHDSLLVDDARLHDDLEKTQI
jgi:hypothetical protein